MNQHIECYSHITGKNVKYTLIGAKLKHRILQEDWGCEIVNNEKNTSPVISPHTAVRNPEMYVASGGLKGYALDAIYENYNIGKNPIIAASTYNVNDFEVGINTRELFETDTVKIELVINVLKISDTPLNKPFVGNHSYENYIDSMTIKYTQKETSSSLGTEKIVRSSDMVHPITFSINTELWCIKDFNPRFKREGNYNKMEDDLNGLHVNGGPKITDKVDFVGASFSFLSSEVWVQTTSNELHIFKIVKDGNIINNDELRRLVNGGDIKYFRDKIETEPNTFISLIDEFNGTNHERCNWANENVNTEAYELKSDTYYSSSYGTKIFMDATYVTTGILMPCVKPGTDITANIGEEGEYWSLTNKILDGPAPDEEPLDPETVEPADNPETEYTPPPWTNEKEYEYPDNEIISGVATNLYLFKPSYSNFIFKGYYKNEDTDFDRDYAHYFIQEACNPSAFELFGAFFKLISGHPTPGEIIARIYQLPFTTEDIVQDMQGGVTVLSAPVYGAVGPITMGTKTYMGDSTKTGEPDTTNIHYYRKLVHKFGTLDLGTVNISRVFNNYLDYTETRYTMNLPYGGGQVELDPDLLFPNNRISPAAVKLIGLLDFDTGELTIKIQINNQFYYETIINVASDRIGTVSDSTAIPIAIAKATLTAAGAVGSAIPGGGGLGSVLGSVAGGMSTPQAASTTGNIGSSTPITFVKIPYIDIEYAIPLIPENMNDIRPNNTVIDSIMPGINFYEHVTKVEMKTEVKQKISDTEMSELIIILKGGVIYNVS